jgi:hypothetical protein
MMIFLIPMLTEKAEAYTRGETRAGLNVHFSNLKRQLKQGKRVIEPHFLTAGFTQYMALLQKPSSESLLFLIAHLVDIVGHGNPSLH